jgi:uncharacterized membrane protein YqaE (UPF0057 family)
MISGDMPANRSILRRRGEEPTHSIRRLWMTGWNMEGPRLLILQRPTRIIAAADRRYYPEVSPVFELITLIATILIPPLGVAMKKGLSSDFWINLVLTLIFYVPGLIHGIYVNYVRDGGRSLA